MAKLQYHNDKANDKPVKEEVIRIAAIIIAFIGVFVFFVKILFF